MLSVVLLADYKPFGFNKLHSATTLKQNQFRHSAEGAETDLDGFAKEGLHQAFAVKLLPFAASSYIRSPCFPNMFEDAIKGFV